MQVVILAAGRGTRMGALTEKTPKSMLLVAGKSILEWKLEMLPEAIDEVIFVIGYLGDRIKEKFGSTYQGKKISYVIQNNPVGGTMDALSAARPLLHDAFVTMNGDDIHTKADIEKCIAHPWAFAVAQVADLKQASRVETDQRGAITAITEADMHSGGPGLAGVGMYVLDTRIFTVPPVTLQGRTETGLPQTMLAAAQSLGISIAAIPVESALLFNNPADITEATSVLSRKN